MAHDLSALVASADVGPFRSLFGLSRHPGYRPVVLAELTSIPVVAAGEGDPATPRRWQAVLVVESVRTTDHREIGPEALTWRTLPLPLMGLDETTWGHDGAVLIGTIETITRETDGRYVATGSYLSDDNGTRFADLVDAQALRWVSVDLEVLESEMIEVYEDGGDTIEDPMFGDVMAFPSDWWERVTSGRIMGGTVCPFPALPQAVIVAEGQEFPEVEADNGLPTLAVTAAASGWAAEQAVDVPARPPADWFADPQLDRLTHLTVTAEGRVFGHIAPWEQDHIGYADRSVRPPRSPSGGAYFATATGVECDDGSRPRTGVLTLGTGHADQRLGWRPASEHYDHTGTAVADVAYGEDDYGPWVAGSLRPGVTAAQVRTLACSDVSGDWRAVGGALDLVGVLVVNVPGFPVPALAASAAALDEPDLIGPRGAQVARLHHGARMLRRGDDTLTLVAAAVISRDPVAEHVHRTNLRLARIEQALERIGPAARRQAADAHLSRILGPGDR